MKRITLTLMFVVLLVASAFAGTPKPIYVSWIPASASLMAGSKPSIRITLDSVPTANTDISLSASHSAIALPGSTVTATSASRYVTFQVTLNGVDADTAAHVTASCGGATVSSPDLTILHGELLRVTFNSIPTPNVLKGSTPVEVKFTMSGPAGPSGYSIAANTYIVGGGVGLQPVDWYSAMQAVSAAFFTIPYNQSIVRFTFTMAPITSGGLGSVVYQGGAGTLITTNVSFVP